MDDYNYVALVLVTGIPFCMGWLAANKWKAMKADLKKWAHEEAVKLAKSIKEKL